MILTEERKSVENHLNGESKAFTIKTDGKAFQILVDGLYSDKIGSIARELMSNAWDAHVRLGVLDVGFEVRLPNPLNPSFSVRDYGCSMEHEFVMDSYSTLFESSKTSSNNEVGAFGLGAKVFLAYTDSCTLNCWLNGELRAYTINLNEQRVPTVTLVHRGPSKEPQGVEVTFAVKQSDFGAFAAAVSKASLGFDVVPRVLGGEISIPVADKSGQGYRLYKGGNLPKVSVRQGCAVYPTSLYHDLPLDYKLVIDVPIGGATVTASREQLALTRVENDDIAARIQRAADDIRTETRDKYAALTTTIAKAKFAFENATLLGKGNYPVSVDLPFGLCSYGKAKNSLFLSNPVHRFHVQYLSKTYVLLDDTFDVVTAPGVKMPRKQKRILAFMGGRYSDRTLFVTKSAAEWRQAKTMLDLPDDHVLKLSEIPDVAVAPRAGGGTGAPRKVIATTRVWAHVEGNVASAGRFNWNRRTDYVMNAVGAQHALINKAVGSDDILYLTEREFERAINKGTINPNNRVDLVVQRLLDTPTTHSAAEVAVLKSLFGSVPHYSRDLMIQKVLKGSSVEALDANLLRWYATMFPKQHGVAENTAKAKRNTMAHRYPLLFGYDTQAIEDYMKMCEKI